MSNPPRRCPATHIALIEDMEIKDTWRCEKPARHRMPHEAKGTRWTFAAGSYSGLSTEHPDFYDMVEDDNDDQCGRREADGAECGYPIRDGVCQVGHR